jgi:hypothetical protein
MKGSETVNWLEEMARESKPVISEIGKKRGRPMGSKNKEINIDRDLTREQWKAAYWKLRRQYRKDCLPK